MTNEGKKLMNREEPGTLQSIPENKASDPVCLKFRDLFFDQALHIT
jgi:hypothetical protein